MKINCQKSERGIALIIVLLVILAFAMLAGGFAYSMRVEMRLAKNSGSQSEMEWAGRSGVEMAKYVIAMQLQVPNEGNYEALNQKWAGGQGGNTNSILDGISLEKNQLGNAVYSVKVVDLERKFNINLADQTFLQQALILAGVDASSFPTIIDSILDWIDLDENSRNAGAETDYYQGLNPPYYCKNGMIDDLSELLLIKGITPEIYWGGASTNHAASAFQSKPLLKSSQFGSASGTPTNSVGLVDLFTPFSSGRININTASQSALEMIPEVDENTARAIIQIRSGPDGMDGTADDVPFRTVGELVNVPGLSRQVVAQLSRYCDVRSHNFEVQVDVEMLGVQRRYVAVIHRNPANIADFQTLNFSWK